MALGLVKLHRPLLFGCRRGNGHREGGFPDPTGQAWFSLEGGCSGPSEPHTETKMLKLTLGLVLVAGLVAPMPSLAGTNNGGGTIGRGCTLDPFNHTMRCIDFDHCTRNSKGERVCQVVVTSTRKVQ